jgi:hypothetical protein
MPMLGLNFKYHEGKEQLKDVWLLHNFVHSSMVYDRKVIDLEVYGNEETVYVPAVCSVTNSNGWMLSK